LIAVIIRVLIVEIIFVSRANRYICSFVLNNLSSCNASSYDGFEVSLQGRGNCCWWDKINLNLARNGFDSDS
jgi:hypothetical protein